MSLPIHSRTSQPATLVSLLLLLIALIGRSADATEVDATLFLVTHYNFSQQDSPPQIEPVRPNGGFAYEYSNVGQFLGQAFANGSSAPDGANTITKMVADDLTPGYPCAEVGNGLFFFRFSVANLDAGNVTARVRVRFYQDAAGAPGALFLALKFPPVTITPGVDVFTCPIDGPDMPDGHYWAGIVFDNNDGASGATAAQLDRLGQGVFGPVDIGSSEDRVFVSTNAGPNLEDAPAGVVLNSPLGGTPPANLGWEIITNCGGLPTLSSTWGRVKSLYR